LITDSGAKLISSDPAPESPITIPDPVIRFCESAISFDQNRT